MVLGAPMGHVQNPVEVESKSGIEIVPTLTVHALAHHQKQEPAIPRNAQVRVTVPKLLFYAFVSTRQPQWSYILHN